MMPPHEKPKQKSRDTQREHNVQHKKRQKEMSPEDIEINEETIGTSLSLYHPTSN